MKFLVLWELELARLSTAMVAAVMRMPAHARALSQKGKLERRYHVVGRHGGAWIYDVDSNEELERLLAAAPVYNFARHDVLALAEMEGPEEIVQSEAPQPARRRKRPQFEDINGNLDSPSTPQLPTYYQDALVGVSWNGVELHDYPYPVAGHSEPYDIVVINLGTNDIAGAHGVPPSGPFQTAQLKLIREVRTNNPDAQLFLTLGSMSGDPELSQFRMLLDGVIDASGDSKIHRIDLGPLGSSKGVGCDWHPSAAEDSRMAIQLLHQMEPILGVTGTTADPNPYQSGD